LSDIILVVGGTGDLGKRLINALLVKGAVIRMLVRNESSKETILAFKNHGVEIVSVDFNSQEDLKAACKGVSCVISTLSGLRNVIVDLQKRILDAAIAAGVPRFIPSDYSIDFTKLAPGENRNLDFRKEFHGYINSTSISATTIFNGAFAELLTEEMPLVLFPVNRVLYWGNADQKLEFTTKDNVAEFTARAAMDPSTPRYLYIAGDIVSPREMKGIASEVTGKKFKLFRPGGLGFLSIMIKIARTVAPGKEDLYPAWQGMQYMHNMMKGKTIFMNLDNNRYPDLQWTPVKEVLSAHLNEKNKNED